VHKKRTTASGRRPSRIAFGNAKRLETLSSRRKKGGGVGVSGTKRGYLQRKREADGCKSDTGKQAALGPIRIGKGEG